MKKIIFIAFLIIIINQQSARTQSYINVTQIDTIEDVVYKKIAFSYNLKSSTEYEYGICSVNQKKYEFNEMEKIVYISPASKPPSDFIHISVKKTDTAGKITELKIENASQFDDYYHIKYTEFDKNGTWTKAILERYIGLFNGYIQKYYIVEKTTVPPPQKPVIETDGKDVFSKQKLNIADYVYLRGALDTLFYQGNVVVDIKNGYFQKTGVDGMYNHKLTREMAIFRKESNEYLIADYYREYSDEDKINNNNMSFYEFKDCQFTDVTQKVFPPLIPQIFVDDKDAAAMFKLPRFGTDIEYVIMDRTGKIKKIVKIAFDRKRGNFRVRIE